MPIELLNDVYGSTLRDHCHRGPNQAGNKSMLAYRADIGVPGYTGYIPSTAAMVLPTKDNCKHTGRLTDEKTKLQAAAEYAETKRTTEYTHCFKKKPSDTRPFSKTGGGYWFSERTLGNKVPFLSKTTYQAEVLQAPDTTAQQLEKSQGLSSTTVVYEAARIQRSQSAEPCLRRPMDTSVTSHGELAGYQTTYGNMTHKTQKLLAESQQRPKTAHAELRAATMPRVMAPGMAAAYSTYKQDFGADGSDPVARGADAACTMTRHSTTHDLAKGTVRNCGHVPRYTGHVPASEYNTSAKAQTTGDAPRPDHKAASCLYALDQYGRGRVPLYTGYKPQANSNITVEQPAHGLTNETTTGDALLSATKRHLPAPAQSYGINSRAGLMTFFHSTGETISDNGLFNAQTYYKIVRPGDGRFETQVPSKTTSYGARFHSGKSMV